MYCYHCGKEIAAAVTFCKYCGTRIRQDEGERIAAIVERIQQGDAAAFEELYGQTQKYVRYVAMQVGGNASNVEDVVQEVYLAIYSKLDTLKDTKAALGWIKTITRNTAVNVYKKEAKYVLTSEDDYEFDNIEETDTLALPEDALDSKDTQQLIAGMLEELPAMQKLVMLDFYFNNRKITEIAEEYGITSGTVKGYLAKGRKGMEDKLVTYQKKTGVKLYTMPLAPVLYVVIRESIFNTVATAVPASLSAAMGTVVAGAATAGGTGGAAATAGVKTAGAAGKAALLKASAVKVVAGITAVTVVGTGTAVYVRNHRGNDVQEIRAVTERFEEACQELDNGELLDCLTKDSRTALKHQDLTREYPQLGDEPQSIQDETDFELELSQIRVEDEEASAYCIYTKIGEDGKRETKKGYLGFAFENGEWKIQLCRASRENFKSGTQTNRARFPELLETELIYNDEIE